MTTSKSARQHASHAQDGGSPTSARLRRRAFLKLAGLGATALAVPSGLEASQQTPAPLPDKATFKARNLYLNQVGYRPDQPKLATIILTADPPPAPDPDDLNPRPPRPPQAPQPWTFHVLSAGSAEPVISGPLSEPFFDPLAGDTVCFADLSALSTPGRYRVVALGHTGDEFAIAADIYAPALRLAMRAFYGQRCGCEVDLGGGYKHRKCHHKGVFGSSSGRSGRLANRGGWHDAGDYGRYIVNSGITCGTLLLAWEMYPNALSTLHLGIPESGRTLPDYLAEVKWNLDWMLTLQDPGDGGVWHKQTSAHFSGFILPEHDHLPSEVIGTGAEPYKSTCSTADFAAVMAIAARCYQPCDSAFAAACLSSARRAFTWCQAHPDVTFRNPPGVATGEYGDQHPADELLWAAAELFHTTHEPAFEQAFLTALQPSLPALRVYVPSWSNVAALALWSYVAACGPSAAESPVCQVIRKATVTAAGRLIERSRQSAYGTTLAGRDFGWGSNSTAANQSLLLLIADRYQPGMAAQSTAMANLHYLLGRNCFGVSWVTHVGVRPFLHPHHRPSVADSIPEPWPGLLSGGPNAHGGDEVANHLPAAAPMRMWLDDERAYSLNEVAINWNAPLVFLLAAAAGAWSAD